MSDFSTRNYFAHGGNELVIGGKLTFLPGATVEGAEGLLDMPDKAPLPSVPDSKATTAAGLRDDFNHLLEVLRESGVLAEPEAGDAPRFLLLMRSRPICASRMMTRIPTWNPSSGRDRPLLRITAAYRLRRTPLHSRFGWLCCFLSATTTRTATSPSAAYTTP